MADPVTVPLSHAQRARLTALGQQLVVTQQRMNDIADSILLGVYTEAQIKDQPPVLTDEGLVITLNDV